MEEYKIVHFSNEFTMEDINEAMSLQDDIIYYTRQISEKNEFHIVNHNNGEFTVTAFITELFKFYTTDTSLGESMKGTKIKGNEKFSIIINTDEVLIERLKLDLNNLLKK